MVEGIVIKPSPKRAEHQNIRGGKEKKNFRGDLYSDLHFTKTENK